ncbi:hypothetical protein [Ochrobactrum sp. A-1]|uniref:hypothetical protein n=1 Tax=Ochrobactrum sp. A-1 TaxID=2920940 RepID=UPI001F0ABB18|nr:hypothetical protein [Ochrobactrum sp. A-1]
MSLRDRLETLLSQLYCQGTIPRNRYGKIARNQLARMLGVHGSYLTPHRDILETYENKIGILHPIDAAIPRMEAVVQKLIEGGTLNVRNGKVDRKQIGDLAGIKAVTSIMDRFPQLIDFYRTADAHVKAIDYKRRDVVASLERLKAFLADGNKEIHKNGLSFDCAKIGKAIGISKHRLRQPPLVDLISEAEAKYEKELRAEGLTGFFHGRVFLFSNLVDKGWNGGLLQRIVQVFQNTFCERPKTSVEEAYLATVQFLSWFAETKTEVVRRVFKNVNDGVHSSQSDWLEALLSYNSWLLGTPSCKNVFHVQNLLQAMATEGLVAHIPISFRSRRPKASGHYPTLAEAKNKLASVNRNNETSADDYLLFATEMLSQAGAAKGIEVDAREQSAFVHSLRSELGKRDIERGNNPAEIIRNLMRRRLELIETAALQKFEFYKDTYERGQQHISVGRDCSKDWRMLTMVREGKAAYRKRLRKWFPLDAPDQAKANLLKLLEVRFDCLVPTSKTVTEPEYSFLKKRALENDGFVDLQASLWPSPEAFGAALVLYLIQTGANPVVGRVMPADTIRPSPEAGYISLNSSKIKAGGKPIYSEIPANCPAAKALLWLADVRRNHKIPISPENAGMFHVLRTNTTFQLMPDEWFRVFFKKLISTVPELHDLRITPGMLRPTVLLLAALEEDGRVRTSVTLGQHGEHVNQRYTGRYPLLLMHDSEIALFNRFYETLAVQNIESAHIILGVEAQEFAKVLDSIARTGLGTLCRDPAGKPGAQGLRCTTLDCYDCPQLILLAKVEEIALLRIWQLTLRDVEGDWLRDHPERWEAVWLPWLCFVDAVEARMKFKFRRIWRDAGRLADKIMNSPDFLPKKPW